MKLLIDNIKRTIIFKDNKAFYKNKKDEVDVTLFFKKSKDGMFSLRKKYSHMLVSEDRNIIFGGGTDLLKIELKKTDKKDIPKLFRKIIALYLMAEMYTNKDILDRRIDKIGETEKDDIKNIADVINRTPLVVATATAAATPLVASSSEVIDTFISKYNKAPLTDNDKIDELTTAIKKNIDTDKGFSISREETHTTNENKEITKWVQVKYLLKDFKEYIETNTTTIDTICTLLNSDGSQRNLVGGTKLSSLTPSVLLKGNVGVAAGRRNGNLLIQSPGVRANGVGAVVAPASPAPVAPAPAAGAPVATGAVAAAAPAAAPVAPAAPGAGAVYISQINQYKDICKIFKECYEYINYLKSLYSAYDTYTKVDNNTNTRFSLAYFYPQFNYEKWYKPVVEQKQNANRTQKSQAASKVVTDLTETKVEPKLNKVKQTGINIQKHIETNFNTFKENLIADNAANAANVTNVNNILYYLALISKEYISLFDYDKYMYNWKTVPQNTATQITESLRKINVIENIITEYFKLLIKEKKDAIFRDANFTSAYTAKKKLIPKNYINSTMLDDIYLEKLVNYNNNNINMETYPEFTTRLKQAAAKISTILHFSGKLDTSTAEYRKQNEKQKP